jgi:LPS-assembly protein
VTRCPAKVPDYHVSASKIEVWPGEQMIAYDVKFWLKDKVIYTMPKYRKSLRKDDSASEFPQMGFYSEDGFFIKQHLEYPLSNKVSLYTDQAYYTKTGYRPVYGASYHENRFAVDVAQGHFRDADGHWVKKEPEYKLSLFSRQLWDLPLNYSFTAVYGKWTDHAKTSWHEDYNLYFSGFPIKFDDSTHLLLGVGFQHVRESYNGSAQNLFRYDATLVKKWSDKFSTWAGYHYVRNNATLFMYDRNELSKQLDFGFTYKLDHMNKIGYFQSYDVANSRIYDQDVTWYRNLHCWEAAVTYRIKRNQYVVDFSIARF